MLIRQNEMLMCCKLPVFSLYGAKGLAAIELPLNHNRLYANLHFAMAFFQTFARIFQSLLHIYFLSSESADIDFNINVIRAKSSHIKLFHNCFYRNHTPGSKRP